MVNKKNSEMDAEDSTVDRLSEPQKPQSQRKPSKHSVGAPPRYETVEEMQELIEKYFDETNHQVITKDGVVYVDGPYTMTGLALALGFTSRQALWNYEHKPEFVDVIARARARVIEYGEGRLYDKDGARGAQFALENFNDGWTSKQEFNVNNRFSLDIAPQSLEQIEAAVKLSRQVEAAAMNAGRIIDGHVIEAKTEPI